MSNLTLRFPVHTSENRLLLPADTALSEDVLADLIAKSNATPYKSQSLMNYGTTREDLLNCIKRPLYNEIFANQEKTKEVLNLMESVQFPLPVLESLTFFKEYDTYTYYHALVVFAFSIRLAKELLPDNKEMMQETVAGPTHDFGKLCVPLDILKKATPLTLSETKHLKHHANAGYVLLTYYLQDTNCLAAKLARDHHERKNGSGYPRGILQTDRKVEIVAVSDVYDALVSPRPYRPISYDNRTALEEITKMAERGEVGWDTLKALVALNRKGNPHYSEITISDEKRGTPPPENVYGVIAKENSSMVKTDN